MGTTVLLGHQLFHGHQVVAELGRGQGQGPLPPALEPVPLRLPLGDVAVAQAHQNRNHAADGRVQRAVEHVVPVQGHVARNHQEHQADQRRCPGLRLPAQPAQQRQHQQQRHQHPLPAGQHGVNQKGDQATGDGAKHPHPGGLKTEAITVFHDRDHGQHRLPHVGDALEPERQRGGDEGGHPKPQAVAKQGGSHGPRSAWQAGAFGASWSRAVCRYARAVRRCARVDTPLCWNGPPWSSR